MFIQIHNRKVHYKKNGSGAPLIFVHGWGGSLYSLHALASLASKDFTAYIIDLPGFGKSDNPPEHWGIEGYGELVKLFIEKIIQKKPQYIGHSFGGEIGIYLASHFPQTIDTLTLCNSSFKRQNKISKIAQMSKWIPKDSNLILKLIYPYIKKLYYTLIRKQSDLMKYPHLEKNFRKIVTQDLSPDTKNIKHKTLVLWGELDTYTPVIWAYELQKNIKNSRLFVFPDVGHDLPIRHPDLAWAKIKEFLQ
ncbi:MAG: alpha/beta hydrolase [Candidatus Roizmanbacteria bacterium]|nr:alpha/beta hydrolase [Candidatus Roizmanbacteria bacterium]